MPQYEGLTRADAPGWGPHLGRCPSVRASLGHATKWVGQPDSDAEQQQGSRLMGGGHMGVDKGQQSHHAKGSLSVKTNKNVNKVKDGHKAALHSISTHHPSPPPPHLLI